MDGKNEPLTFSTEEERRTAIDNLDERDPSNELRLDEIMNAPLKSNDEVDKEKPTDQKPDIESKEEKVEDKKEEEKKDPSLDEILTIKKGDLPQGFDTPGKLFKSYKEAQELIERQTKFIKEKLGGTDQNLQSAMNRAEQAEKELAELRKKIEKPAQTETKKEDLSPIPESVSPQIKQIRIKLQELSADPITNEEEIHQLRLNLDDLWLKENERTSILIERANKRSEDAEKKALEASTTANKYIEESKKSESQKLAAESLKREFQEMDNFSVKYKEFKTTKPMAEVENDYAKWASEVTNLYYGMPINIESQQGIDCMHQALSMLEKGAPDITEKCRVAGVPISPSEDIKKYLEICDLLNYRDGYRINPNTGKKESVQRYHSPSGKYIPDTFPSLSDAYENRRVRDGYYDKRIREAFTQGGESMVKAISKRDEGAVEIDNTSGASSVDAGVKMSTQDATKVINEINEIEALRRKKNGDPSLFNKLNEAFKVMGLSSIEV